MRDIIRFEQLFRMSLALAFILQRKVHITKIRHNRPKKGLKNQHLAGVAAFSFSLLALADCTQARHQLEGKGQRARLD